MSPYVSLESGTRLRRRAFLGLGSRTLLGASLLWEASRLWPQESQKQQIPARPQTNLADALKIPKTRLSLPGPFPGRVVEVHDERTWSQGAAHPDSASVRAMVEKGITTLTGKNLRKSFKLLFSTEDLVGIKVNPVGAGLIAPAWKWSTPSSPG